MTFPHQDPFWTAPARLVRDRASPGARILAPDIFWWVFPRIHRYARTAIVPDETHDWAILHKGMLGEVTRDALRRITTTMHPVLANEVFVVFGPAAPDSEAIRATDHFRAFQDALPARLEQPDPTGASEDDPVLPEPGIIAQFPAMSDAELRHAMDRFWRHGGYMYETLRDRTYYAELDRLIAGYCGAAAGEQVLDLCCGTGRLGALLPGAAAITGIDISTVALGIAGARHAGDPRQRFAAMAAGNLGFPDASFDRVLFVDAIEHVRDPAQVLAETARVLRPGGAAMLTVANSDGLNQRIARRLGTGAFVTNYQHLHEFTWGETQSMLRAVGLRAERADGIFLYPYWGVPGVDDAVRHLTDDDPEIVAAMLELGRRAGPDYAYAFAVLARKES
ncbi:class I SAM-dependent methyltransferase [Roseomonas sp. CECT 9278]|uniref:class I SAM-dependent methyltransferase n=1 Tax=Roseomonas sp. CECT 9278 TaxID=2845823 RepID=UPI001E2F3746|nr:class I SAM-dependent methyltransferase [Roseomonas sp. CECT 9278]CAH0277607.1 2-methoxy-6-polyprenyl-1,4-benzoquinol methylase, mitochondrial [Roseomonas sp. CECT 9278]